MLAHPIMCIPRLVLMFLQNSPGFSVQALGDICYQCSTSASEDIMNPFCKPPKPANQAERVNQAKRAQIVQRSNSPPFAITVCQRCQLLV
ncbi:hypothetical protein B0T26DRAFT_517580 [Lasiosphaeria miniovina]|uniref:Secreted protein n=1 Tax=Lasiosphaeria miniovina TaxID=1954250 RepID=A0AA39ZUR6_9PEZI|nr:uncharacterized protein B0T26DRAFT_517580 [Lasiosphaeria miniovina]KAK0703905.1 hypothetical protein B0T26DRAFT_517580 [Lasiosphaeria miniovina]